METGADPNDIGRTVTPQPQNHAPTPTEAHPDVDPKSVRFTDLFKWVQQLPGFEDDPKRCGEKILEAIQAAWIDESE